MASVTVRTIVWTAMVIALLATGIILVLYSAWGQDRIRETLLQALNSKPGISAQFGGFRLHFPLDVEIQDLALAQEGDTIVKAGALNASVKLMPLLKGKIEVEKATLSDGIYSMGAPDSAMWMKITAGEVALRPVTVTLNPMDIDIPSGRLSDARVEMILNTDTTATPTDTTAATPMTIRIGHLKTENLTYNLRMLPTIDSIGTNIREGLLSHGCIDMIKQTVTLESFVADSVSAAYIAPDSATIAATPVPAANPDAPQSKPWTIMIDTISMARSEALYTTRGVTPLPGLDFAYIQAKDMDLTVLNFYNQATNLKLPLTLRATERCGVTLDATGTFSLDSAAMYLDEFDITTKTTKLNAQGILGMGDMFSDPSLPMQLAASGYCSIEDLSLMFPGYIPYLKLLPQATKPELTLNLSGTAGYLNISDLDLNVSGCASLSAKGAIQNAFMPDRIAGDINLSGRILNVKSILYAFVDPKSGVAVPPMRLAGNFKMRPGSMGGNLTATTLGGKIALDAKYTSKGDGYDLNIVTDRFPLQAFMTDMGLGEATMSLKASGNSFDVLNPNANLDASANIKSLVYGGYEYKGIDMDAKLHGGNAQINAQSTTDDLNLSLQAAGNLTGDKYDWTISADGSNIDLYALKFSETPSTMSLEIDAQASYTPATQEIGAEMHIPDFYYKGTEATEFSLSDISARLHSTDTLTSVALHNRDLSANAAIPMGFTGISAQADTLMAVLSRQLANKQINVDSLQRVCPKFDISLTGGTDNFINDILSAQKMSLKHISLVASNDSLMYMNSNVLEFNTGSMLLDTIALDMAQAGEKMHLIGTINNRKGNLDDFAHIKLDGTLNLDNVSVRISQQNTQGKTGFDFGAVAAVADSVVSMRFFPLNPVIGYKSWSVNLDNYLRYDFAHKHIDANLKMKGDDSSVLLYTDHSHASGEAHNDSINNVVLKISDVHLADWIVFNPFAPPITGNLSADMNLEWDGGSSINGSGNVALTDFFYDKKKVASMVLDLDVETNTSGTVRAKADLMVDGEKTMTLAGNLNDQNSDSPFNLDFSIIRFPLSTVNPFMPDDMALLTGMLYGNMMISGDTDHPIINGEIYFEDAAFKAAITNTTYAFSDVKIPVVDNIITLKDFSISGANENPLFVNGEVNIKDTTSPTYDISLKANNMMLVNTTKAARGASAFGKAYIDLDATAKGSMSYLNLNANLTVLSGTNVTYIMTEDMNEITQSANEDMVKFVNLSDSSMVAQADSIVNQNMLMAINAKLTIQNATTISVNLPTGPRDKVVIQPQGSVSYSQSPLSEEGRISGRIDIEGGRASYTIPVVGSEKKFTFDQGSYIAFNGDILNPVLNIMATDQVKANVNVEGQNSRLVNFDILLSVTGTLEKMDVVFNLATDDDLTVANELQAMSPEQRANQAMNLLLYNMYTGPGTSASANLNGNPLFSFLESQLNNWAANNIKGVELSFGIDQYNQTTNGATSSTMSYSYQVSKTLFNDRFKIVVGGNYTTDNNADENLAENLFNDISFEYFLNQKQTMVLKLFRHMGYESILEGEITETGVGFVYRKKLDHLSNMLPKFIRPKRKD